MAQPIALPSSTSPAFAPRTPTVRISNATIDELVQSNPSQCEQFLLGRTDFEDLENWPADAQFGLFRMAWALGAAFSFPKFQAAAHQEDRLTTARESKMTEKGTTCRWALNANMRSGRFPISLNLAIGVQTALETLGFDPHGLDGVFGNDTRTALTSFQSTMGLKSTVTAVGIDDVPKETIDALADELQTQGFTHYP